MQCEFENEGTRLVREVFKPESYNGNAMTLSYGFGESKKNYYTFTDALRNKVFLLLANDQQVHKLNKVMS